MLVKGYIALDDQRSGTPIRGCAPSTLAKCEVRSAERKRGDVSLLINDSKQ
jgi:hypothetical protein